MWDMKCLCTVKIHVDTTCTIFSHCTYWHDQNCLSASDFSFAHFPRKDTGLVWNHKNSRHVESTPSTDSFRCAYILHGNLCSWSQDNIFHQLHHLLFTHYEAVHCKQQSGTKTRNDQDDGESNLNPLG